MQLHLPPPPPSPVGVHSSRLQATAAGYADVRVLIFLRTPYTPGLGYGKGYTYPPDNGYIRGCEEGFMPKGELHDTTFFNPKDVEPGHTLYPN